MRGSDVLGGMSTRLRWRLLIVTLAVAAGLFGFFLPRIANRSVPDAIGPVVSASKTAAQSGPTASYSVPTRLKDVPVYYVGRENGLLYREFRDLAARGSRAETAVAALLDVAPLDPDYRSLWSVGSGVQVSEKGDTIVVDLPASAFGQLVDPVEVRTAMHQVVYTVTAALGDPSGVKGVQLTVGGSPNLPAAFKAHQIFHRDGLVPMPALWVTSPQNQASVPDGTIAVSGTTKPGSSVPEVSVVNVATKAEVGRWTAQLTGESAGWTVWQLEIPLSPGSYEIKANTVESGVTYTENKIVTVPAAGQ